MQKYFLNKFLCYSLLSNFRGFNNLFLYSVLLMSHELPQNMELHIMIEWKYENHWL
jgi:hypothetical protein